MFKTLMFLLLFVAVSVMTAREGRAQDAAVAQSAGVVADASPEREAVQKKRLETMLSTVGIAVEGFAPRRQTQALREVRILWKEQSVAGAGANGSALASPGAQAALSLAAERKSEGSIRTPRSLEMSSEQVLVLAVTADAQLRWWTLASDPRILRAESPGEDNLLSGRVLQRSSAELLVTIPDEAEIVELRIYKPTINDDRLSLQLVGVVRL